MRLLFVVLLCHVTLCEELEESESRRLGGYFVSPPLYSQNNVFQTLKSQNSYKGYTTAGFETSLCKTPPPCLNPKTLPTNVNRTFFPRPSVQNGPYPHYRKPVTMDTCAVKLSFPRVLYASMSSCWGYAQLANVHLGRQVDSETELEGMCPTQFWNGTGYFDGYGTQFRKRCIANTDGGFICVNVAGSGTEGTDISIQSILSSYLVKSDQKTFALFYRCVDNRYADYVALSSRPWMEKPAAHQALGQVLDLGFPESEVRFLPCRPPAYNNDNDGHQQRPAPPVYQSEIFSQYGK